MGKEKITTKQEKMQPWITINFMSQPQGSLHGQDQ